MIKGKYVFIGEPDDWFPGLNTGSIYKLEIEEHPTGFFEDFLGWLLKDSRPVIVSPFRCPYRSWRTFWNNWREV